MAIHGDGRETVFNALQVRIEYWLRFSNFFEVRESFVCCAIRAKRRLVRIPAGYVAAIDIRNAH